MTCFPSVILLRGVHDLDKVISHDGGTVQSMPGKDTGQIPLSEGCRLNRELTNQVTESIAVDVRASLPAGDEAFFES